MTYPGGAPEAERQGDQNATRQPQPTVMMPGLYGAGRPEPTNVIPEVGRADPPNPTVGFSAWGARQPAPHSEQGGIAAPTFVTPSSPAPAAPPVSGTPHPQPSSPAWGQQPSTPGLAAAPLAWEADAGPAQPAWAADAGPAQPAWTAEAGAAQPRKRLPLVPILAALAAVFFLGAATMGTLYAAKSSAYSREIGRRDAALSAKNAELDKMRGDLKKANEDLGKVKTDLSGSQNQADELKRQKEVISKCFKALGELGQAAQNGDKATVTKKQAEVRTACNEAERYMG